MRVDETKIGEQYEMWRGNRTRLVTLIDKDRPSRKGWVTVRAEEGVKAGEEVAASSRSLFHLPGKEPPPPRKRPRAVPRLAMQAPPGWEPKPGDVVAWTRTLGSRCTVLSVDADRGVARIRGKVMGAVKDFDALVGELTPYRFQPTTVTEGELERRLAGRLPEKQQAQGSEGSPKLPDSVEETDDLVDRLVFDPKLLRFYRLKFARRASSGEAEERLRAELRKAERIRKWHGEYLRLRVPRRFEVVLRKRPIPGDLDSNYVTGIRLLVPSKSQKKSRRRKAA